MAIWRYSLIFIVCIYTEFQRIQPRILRICSHTLVSLFMVFVIIHCFFIIWTTEIDFTDKYFQQGYENKELLLSIWVTVFTILCFGFYSVIDIMAIYGRQSVKCLKTRKRLYDVAAYILFSIVFPLSALTSTFYWGLYYWDRERMRPKQMDEVFPSYWIWNHLVHTCPAPVSVLYMFTDIRKEPSKSTTLPTLITFMALYAWVFFKFREDKGTWIYPVMEALTSSQIIWLSITSGIAALVYYFLGYYLYGIIKGLRSNVTSKLKKIEAINFKREKKP